MKRNLILIAILVVVALIGCPKKPRHTVASESQPSSVAQPAPAPATPPPPPAPAPTPPPVAPLPAAPAGPNMSITFNTNFLKDILGGLCSTGYQIYLGDPQNYIIFRELKTLQNIPASGEVEVSMRMDVAIKKYGIPYKDQAEATIRLKLTTARKNNDIILRGDGRLISIKTSFGPKLDELTVLLGEILERPVGKWIVDSG